MSPGGNRDELDTSARDARRRPGCGSATHRQAGEPWEDVTSCPCHMSAFALEARWLPRTGRPRQSTDAMPMRTSGEAREGDMRISNLPTLHTDGRVRVQAVSRWEQEREELASVPLLLPATRPRQTRSTFAPTPGLCLENIISFLQHGRLFQTPPEVWHGGEVPSLPTPCQRSWRSLAPDDRRCQRNPPRTRVRSLPSVLVDPPSSLFSTFQQDAGMQSCSTARTTVTAGPVVDDLMTVRHKARRGPRTVGPSHQPSVTYFPSCALLFGYSRFAAFRKLPWLSSL